MADIPSANELHDWLHELPAGYMDDISRRGDLGEAAEFELETTLAELTVFLDPNDSPPIRIAAGVPVDEYKDSLQFQTRVTQLAAGVPGHTERLDGDHADAINGGRTVVFAYSFYDDATKQALLSTVMTLADAAHQVSLLGPAASGME